MNKNRWDVYEHDTCAPRVRLASGLLKHEAREAVEKQRKIIKAWPAGTPKPAVYMEPA